MHNALGLRRGLGRLGVVVVEVALEVEVRELVALRDGKKLLERGIRRDGVLVLEVVLLYVVVDTLRDLRARDKRALRKAEERAELIRDLYGALEDGERTGLVTLGTILDLRAALALAGILDLTVYTLVKALDVGKKGGNRLTNRVEVVRDGLEVLIKRRRRDGGYSGGNRLNGRRRNNNGRNSGGGRGLGGLGNLYRLGSLNNGGNNGNLNNFLLGGRLACNGLGRGRTHHTRCGGSI